MPFLLLYQSIWDFLLTKNYQRKMFNKSLERDCKACGLVPSLQSAAPQLQR